MRKGDLTQKQFKVLKFIFDKMRASGNSPTWLEICNRFNLSSTGSARSYLEALERKGFLTRTGSARGIQLEWDKVWQIFGIPLVGNVPAGKPTLAQPEHVATLSPDDLYPLGEGYFALRVEGDSMIDAHIVDGDLVIVHKQSDADHGDIVVAQIEEDNLEEVVTVKKLVKRRGKLYLEPANPNYQPIELNGGKIIGKVTRVVRTV